jgi:cholesterol transport system auxiliary component
MRKLLLTLTLTLLCLCSCAGMFRQDHPERQNYALEVVRAFPPLKEPAFAGKLDIRRLGAAPAFSGRNLVYRMSEATYETDFYNLFLVNPGEMVTQQVRDWVHRANLFTALTVPGSRLESDFTLEGQVVELYGDFEQGRGAAVITLQLFLVRNGGTGGAVILHQGRYEARRALEERSPVGLVRGYNQALAAILLDLERDLLRLATGS